LLKRVRAVRSGCWFDGVVRRRSLDGGVWEKREEKSWILGGGGGGV
jgi:hypothetical protein